MFSVSWRISQPTSLNKLNNFDCVMIRCQNFELELLLDVVPALIETFIFQASTHKQVFALASNPQHSHR
uniref:Uncharacterized protein n=1 Tax=Steinernema glaseri TaxID=37863 RepID=A0A1I8ASJ8_9BILA